ncbi:MAG: hypothetical protein AAFN59_01005 [Pseudomonadota bacterium]
MRAITLGEILTMAVPVSAMAQVMNTNQAGRALFPVRGSAVVVASELSGRDQTIAKTLVDLLEKQQGEPIRYFFSIAYSPADGWASQSLQSANNFHSVAAADAAALRACDAAKSGGTCQVVARVLPRGYEPKELTMSVSATDDFRKRFRRAPSPKAFAISPASGAWGTGADGASAISNCGVTDCTVVIKD